MTPGVSNVSVVQEQPDLALASVVKRLREERNTSQEQLAFAAGITASALSRIERGLNNPGWTTVKRLASALGMTMLQFSAEVEGEG